MGIRGTRLTRALCGSVTSLLAGGMLFACAGTTDETAATTSEALSGPGNGVFHSNVTRGSWHHGPSRHHAGWDDGHRCHPRSLDFCPLFDNEFIGEDGGASCEHVTTDSCPDRVDTWDSLIVFDFAIAVTSDCRFGQWAPPLLSDTDVVDYLNDLSAFTLQFFGCPAQGTTDKLTFDLIPSALDSHHFTTADLKVLSDTYVAAVAQALSDSGLPPLTDPQARQMSDKLERLAQRVPHQIRSHKFDFSTCTADAPATSDLAIDDGVNRCE
jgi:hypothetical protein